MITTRFDVLYDAAVHAGRYEPLTQPIYGIPHRSRPVPLPGMPRYRGIDREPLEALSIVDAQQLTEMGAPHTATAATILLEEIESTTGREDGWLTKLEDARKVWAALGDDQFRYEIIFAREFEDSERTPDRLEYLGSDAAYFVGDHFSCICDALFLPRWHGCDEEGLLFGEHFSKLNRHGLFETNAQALDYLRYYLSFDWTERSDNFTSIEVYAVETV